MSAPDVPDLWRKCNSCKKPILFGAQYWVCNVSTCNRKRTGLVFCSVSCWDAHLPLMNHRESWAEERQAPTRERWAEMLEEEKQPKKRIRKEKPEPEAVAEAPKQVAAPVVIRRTAK